MKTKLRDIAEIRSGYQFRGKVEASDDPNVAVIQIKDLADRLSGRPGGRVDVQLADLVRVRLDNPDPHFVEFGDVLFLSRGHRQIAAVISEPVTKTVATGYFFVLRPDTRCVRSEFLSWLINQPTFQEVLRPLSQGTHMPLVSKTDFQDLTIVLPSLTVQDRILKLHNLIDREWELAALLQQKRGELVQAVSQELISGRLKLKES
jgi:hypothetical protein